MREVIPDARRDPNLDLLRATAIGLVIVYHVVQMWPTPLNTLRKYTALGAYGVDLFFVLSGWLVGGLYWREQKENGRVSVIRFISRRILRTVPCYFVAFLISWGAVIMSDPKRSTFDPDYFFFLQNYEVIMPYFLISWSLCIEEHFYLVFPIAMQFITQCNLPLTGHLWLICLLPLAARIHESHQNVGVFGYAWTATHFRFEGLLAGVLASRMYWHSDKQWNALVTWSKRLYAPVLASAIILYFGSFEWFYTIGLALVAIGFLFLLVSLVAKPPVRFSTRPSVRYIALGSYSLYLTHAIMIHLSRQTIQHFALHSDALCGLVFAGLIMIGGWLFYLCVEKPFLLLRGRLVPSRVNL